MADSESNFIHHRFCYPIPDFNVKSIEQENFDWLEEHTIKLPVKRAKTRKQEGNYLTWRTNVVDSVLDFL